MSCVIIYDNQANDFCNTKKGIKKGAANNTSRSDKEINVNTWGKYAVRHMVQHSFEKDGAVCWRIRFNLRNRIKKMI